MKYICGCRNSNVRPNWREQPTRPTVADHLIAMTAHGKLWEETHPQHPLTGGYHLLILPKDGTALRA
jgi:hypothetical protein